MTADNQHISNRDLYDYLMEIEKKIDNVTNTNLNTGKYLSTKEVAKYLNRSASWVYHQVSDGLIPCHRDKSGLRFLLEEIDDWMDKKRQRGRVSPFDEVIGGHNEYQNI
jgi:excisionase family DNA binding protein